MVMRFDEENERLKALLGGADPMGLPPPPDAPRNDVMSKLSMLLGAGEDFQKPMQEAAAARKRLDEDFKKRLAEARGEEQLQSTLKGAFNMVGNIGRGRAEDIARSASLLPGAKPYEAPKQFQTSYDGDQRAKQATGDLVTRYGMDAKNIGETRDDALKAAEYGALAKGNAANAAIRNQENETKRMAQIAAAEQAAKKAAQDKYEFDISMGMKEADAKAQRSQTWAKIDLDREQLEETTRSHKANEAIAGVDKGAGSEEKKTQKEYAQVGVPGLEIADPSMVIPDKPTADRIRKLSAATDGVRRDIARFKALIAKHGLMTPSKDAVKEMEQVKTAIVLNMKNVKDLGALSGPDMGLMEDLLGALPGMSIENLRRSQGSVLAGLDRLSQASQDEYADAYKSAGYRERRAGVPAATTAAPASAPVAATGGLVTIEKNGKRMQATAADAQKMVEKFGWKVVQ